MSLLFTLPNLGIAKGDIDCPDYRFGIDGWQNHNLQIHFHPKLHTNFSNILVHELGRFIF
ncbi:hypothetical protein H6G32_19270 [Cylindrospermum sp. FACHB-282]|nr:hypothetical protein [Cylindrospermum sp. FACHB-282]